MPSPLHVIVVLVLLTSSPGLLLGRAAVVVSSPHQSSAIVVIVVDSSSPTAKVSAAGVCPLSGSRCCGGFGSISCSTFVQQRQFFLEDQSPRTCCGRYADGVSLPRGSTIRSSRSPEVSAAQAYACCGGDDFQRISVSSAAECSAANSAAGG